MGMEGLDRRLSSSHSCRDREVRKIRRGAVDLSGRLGWSSFDSSVWH